MKVLVTGGAGYIGNELIYRLIKNPQIDNIIVYDNLCRRNYNLFLDDRINREKLDFINADLLDTRRLSEALTGVNVVYHLAGMAVSSFSKENEHLFDQINHWGTSELVYYSEKNKINKFIYLSTDAVYGYSNKPIEKTTWVKPASLYAKSMLKGEKEVEQLKSNMETYIIRCSNVYGYSPSVRFESLINRFMFEINFMGRIRITGKDSQVRSFIHIDKVAQVLANLILEKENVNPGTYNLVEKNMSVAEITETLKEIYPYMEIVRCGNKDTGPYQRILKPDLLINQLMMDPQLSLKHELENFRNQFKFHSKPVAEYN